MAVSVNTAVRNAASSALWEFSILCTSRASGGQAVAGKDEFTLLEELSKKSNMKIPASLAALKDKSVIFDMVFEKDQMKQAVSDFLKVE